MHDLLAHTCILQTAKVTEGYMQVPILGLTRGRQLAASWQDLASRVFSLALNIGPHSVLYLNYLITKKGGGISHKSLNIQIPLKTLG